MVGTVATTANAWRRLRSGPGSATCRCRAGRVLRRDAELNDIETVPTNATIVIPPPTYGDIEVSVVDGSGDPVTDNVSVGGYDGQFPVDAAGEAYLSGVPTGTWYVTVFDPWGNWLAETQVTVVDGGVSTAQIVIDPVPEYGVLDVHVEDANGTPLENFSVYPDAGIAVGV